MNDLDIEESTTGTAVLDRRATISEILDALPDARLQTIQAWLDGLKAMKWAWDPATKSRIYEPDHKVRTDCAKQLAAYLDGLPAQITEVRVSKTEPGAADVVAAARNSPAVRDALRAMLLETGEVSNS